MKPSWRISNYFKSHLYFLILSCRRKTLRVSTWSIFVSFFTEMLGRDQRENMLEDGMSTYLVIFVEWHECIFTSITTYCLFHSRRMHMHIAGQEELGLFIIYCNPSLTYLSLKDIFGMAHFANFCTTNISTVLSMERWQSNK